MQIIFQDPYASLNPRMKVGDSVGHGLQIHNLAQGKELQGRVVDMMERVGLTPADILYGKYPHQLSGGQRQRVVIARALVTHPSLVVADEPIAMADVSVRALLLDLMLRLKREFDLTYMFITHDLATAKYICDRIAIMYLGKIVELGTLEEVYRHAQHPYTQALLAAVPVPDPRARRQHPIPQGEIPNPINPPSGCRFHPRCPYAFDVCPKTRTRVDRGQRRTRRGLPPDSQAGHGATAGQHTDANGNAYSTGRRTKSNRRLLMISLMTGRRRSGS